MFALLLMFAASFAQTLPTQSQSLVEEAQATARGGRFADAIAKYQQALEISPRNADAEIGLAQAYRAVHNYEEAKNILERSAREHPKNAAPLALLGDLEIELQTYAAAIRHLNAALALKPDDESTRIWLAVAYKSKGDVPNALGELAKVLARNPKNALAYYERAQIRADRNENAAALRDAQKTVDLQPNPAGRLLLAKILLRPPPSESAPDGVKRCARAAQALEPLMPERARDSETLFLLSRAYQCAGQTEQAEKTLAEFETASKNDRATKENQTEAKHLVQQANDAAMKNDFQGALDLLQQALGKDPTYAAAYSQLAKLYYSAGDVEKASDAISQALARNPYQPDFLYVLGKILEKQGKLDEALAAFAQTALVNPKEADAYFEIGAIYQQRNDRERALAAYKKAVELSPDDPDYRKALSAMKPREAPQ
jgi:tetratricopeptide (TPR) repeat protein